MLHGSWLPKGLIRYTYPTNQALEKSEASLHSLVLCVNVGRTREIVSRSGVPLQLASWPEGARTKMNKFSDHGL